MRSWKPAAFGLLLLAAAACGDSAADTTAESAPVTTAAPLAATTTTATTTTSTTTTTTTIPPTTTAAPTTAAPLAPEALYAANCAACYGAELEGGIGPALAGAGSHLDHHDQAELAEAIGTGRNEMPAFADALSAEEIQAGVGFIRAADAAEPG